MGKASSNKKVARAAGTGGGRTSRGRTPWAYFGVILFVVALGVAGTWTSRNHRLSEINANGSTAAPAVGSTESAGYAVDICGKLQANIPTPKTNPVGITTQGDGIIHISPTKASVAGKNATLGVFASAIKMKLNAAELQIPGGKLYTDGASCEGSPGHIYVQRFAYPLDTTGVLETTLATKVHLDDGAMYTIAFLPSSKKTTIPPPAKAVVTKLQSLQAAQTASTSTTVAGSGLSGTTATTTAGSATTATTTAGSATTATTTGSATTAPSVATTVPATSTPTSNASTATTSAPATTAGSP